MEADLREASIRAAWPVRTRRLGWNPVWLLLARLAAQAQGMLLAVLVARRLGEAGFGLYSLVTALVFVGNVFTTFGTDTWLVRQVARQRQVELPEVPAALGLQLILSVGTIAALWVWTWILPPASAGFVAGLRLYSLSLLPLAFFSVFSALLRGLERMDLYLALNLVTASVQLVAVGLALRSGGSLPTLMATLLAVQGFAMLCSYGLCRWAAPGYRPKGRLEPRPLARLFKAAWPLASLGLLGVVYQRLGIFALSSLGGAVETGLYSAAARVVEAAKLGHLAVLGALLPALARLQERPGEKGEARRLFWASTWGLLGLGLLGALFFSFFAPFDQAMGTVTPERRQNPG
jgi:O-antigen/teichoic acid export membrane protein